MLQIINARKAYHSEPILTIPSLELEKGIFWLEGLNGSGKTTFLRMIAALLPFEGDIILNGISQRKDPLAYRRKVSWAAAEPVYPAFITGQDLLLFYQQIRKASSEQARQLVDFFGVEAYIMNPLGSYSSGMIKRLSLLLAFIGDIDLIILDEPLATLDPEMASQLPVLIKQYSQEKKCSILFSSHFSLDIGSLESVNRLFVYDGTVSTKKRS